ncbi:inositol monophosphatase family protein [Anaerobacillus isosaccharinicus]|uniref:Inositol monophosphatase n=1 Tax=Anaerobacillus isosaccharinicus TaxID=1532552 RepID=A0A1S2MG43_9BACI|nr:inositol monophosphatase family protein [Anaerobacillus isosaccharinicus]MBA5587814.1 inositol monophosphatase family protein [Anaerobacillus isosaccharinicus]QOY34031.1 inositol monophosphatase family protein [Anaerobacillus isosaccharinicus]
MNYNNIYELAKSWTKEAGENLRESLKHKIEVEFKTSASDLVTKKDREIEQFFAGKISEHFPEHMILGEEGTVANQEYIFEEAQVWVIDPIDGTTNFVNQKMNFAISVAFYDQGEPIIGVIYDPMKDELFTTLKGQGAFLNGEKIEQLTAVTVEEALISLNSLWTIPNDKVDEKKVYPIVEKARGIRYIGSAALEIAWISVGRLDAYVDFRLSPWDIGAGIVLLKELGGEATTLAGEDINMKDTNTTLFSRPGLASEIRNYFN